MGWWLRHVGLVIGVLAAGVCAQTGQESPKQDSTSPEMLKNIAVIPLRNGNGITQADAELITDRLNAELFRTGKIALLERDQIREILKEQGFQNSGVCSDEACLVQMGQVLGVQEIVSGSIGQLGTIVVINLRSIDVSTGRILRVVSQDIEGKIEDVVSILPGVAQELVGLKGGGASIKSGPRTPVRAPPPVVPSVPTPIAPPMRPAKNTAMISVISQPEGAEVLIDGKKLGVTPYVNNLLKPGEYHVVVGKTDYDSYSEDVDLGAGRSDTVDVALAYLYGRLNVQTTPTGARLSIDKKAVGSTPFSNNRLTPGTYRLDLALAGYDPLSARISVEQNQDNAFSYSLLSASQADSVKAMNTTKHKGRRWARRVIFGFLAVGAWTGGILLNQQVSSSIKQEERYFAAYSVTPDTAGPIAASVFDNRYTAYRDQTKETDNLSLLRNITYGVAGGLSFFLVLSIPF